MRDRLPPNIVFLDVAGTGRTPADIVLAQGVGMGGGGLFDPTIMRSVTHIDVSRAGVDKALGATQNVLAAWLFSCGL